MSIHNQLYFSALFDESSFRQALQSFADATEDTTLSHLLQFVSSVDNYQRLRSQDNMMQMALSIINQFHLDQGNNELFLPDEQVQAVLNKISSVNSESQKFLRADLFNDISASAFQALQFDAFPRFANSTQFKHWMTEMIRSLNSREEFDQVFGLRSRHNQEMIKAAESATANIAQSSSSDWSSFKLAKKDDTPLPAVPPTVQLADRINDKQRQTLQSLGLSVESLERLVMRMARPQRMGGVKRLEESKKKPPKRHRFLPKFFGPAKPKVSAPFTGLSVLHFLQNDVSLPDAIRNDKAACEKLANLLFGLGVLEGMRKKAPHRRLSSSSSAALFVDDDSVYNFTHRKKVVVVGGGFSGLRAARRLAADFDVSVIDERSHYEINIAYHDLFNKPETMDKIRFDFKEILENIRFVQGKALHVTTEAVYTTNQGREITVTPFDYVILSTGASYYNPFPIRTKDESRTPATIIFPYKSNFILDNLENLKKAKRVAVIGGGPLAVEIVGELGYFMRDDPDAQVVQFTHCNFLLERHGTKVHKSTYQMMKRIPNVKVLFNRRVMAIEDDHILFNFNKINSGVLESHVQSMQFDAIVISVGMYPNTSMMDRFMSSSLSTRGYVEVEKTSFRVARNSTDMRDTDPNVFDLKPLSEEDLSEGTDSTEVDTFTDTTEMEVNTKQEEMERILFDVSEPGDDGPISESDSYYDHIFALGDIALGTQEEKMAGVARRHAHAIPLILRNLERDMPLKSVAYKPQYEITQLISVGPKKALIVGNGKVLFRGSIPRRLKYMVINMVTKEIVQQK